MNTVILNTFISKLNFINKKIILSQSRNFSINIKNNDNDEHKIKGIITIIGKNNQEELITFESQIIKTDDLLIFKSKYRYDTNNQEENNDNHTYEKEEVNTFAIVKSEKKNLFGPKLKYLLHLVNNNLEKIYVVSKKYQFENGISENFTLLSMKEKELIDDINNCYEKTIKTKR